MHWWSDRSGHTELVLASGTSFPYQCETQNTRSIIEFPFLLFRSFTIIVKLPPRSLVKKTRSWLCFHLVTITTITITITTSPKKGHFQTTPTPPLQRGFQAVPIKLGSCFLVCYLILTQLKQICKKMGSHDPHPPPPPSTILLPPFIFHPSPSTLHPSSFTLYSWVL